MDCLISAHQEVLCGPADKANCKFLLGKFTNGCNLELFFEKFVKLRLK
jgi:hypothetical protein